MGFPRSPLPFRSGQFELLPNQSGEHGEKGRNGPGPCSNLFTSAKRKHRFCGAFLRLAEVKSRFAVKSNNEGNT